MAHLKGQHVNLLLKRGSTYGVIASSTNCSLDITANTADAAAKDDPGEGIFDNPEFTNYSWTASNESFLVDIAYLGYLLDLVINGNGEVDMQFGNDLSYGNRFAKQGRAIISNLTVDAANGDFAKLSLSLDGNGELTGCNPVTVTPVTNILPKIKGKALMIAMRTGAGSTPAWQTIACASSHKLTVSLNLSDITDKDYNDKTVLKEVTGKSVSLSTENLIEAIQGATPATGAGIENLYELITEGTTVKMAFGYYPSSIGQSIHSKTEPAFNGWGDPETTLLEGDFLVTSLSTSGANKEDAPFSAEFQNKGAVSVTAPAAAALSEEE